MAEMRTAVVLCGGKGSRLQPVLGNIPKCLAPVAGKPFIHYVLDHLVSQGIGVCLFLSNPEVEDQLDNLFGGEYKGMELGYWCNQEPKGTGSDLGDMFRAGTLNKYQDPVLVVNGDTWSNFSLDGLWDYTKFPNFKALVVRTFQGGFCVNSGVYLLSKEFFGSIPPTSTPEGGSWGLDSWIDEYRKSRGEKSGVCYFVDSSQFLDIGTPKRYAGAETFLKQQGVING